MFTNSSYWLCLLLITTNMLLISRKTIYRLHKYKETKQSIYINYSISIIVRCFDQTIQETNAKYTPELFRLFYLGGSGTTPVLDEIVYLQLGAFVSPFLGSKSSITALPFGPQSK
jgi:hypothetical protein